MNITRLRIPTGRRQTSWLFTSAAEKLNSGLPRTTLVSGQNGRHIFSIWSSLLHMHVTLTRTEKLGTSKVPIVYYFVALLPWVSVLGLNRPSTVLHLVVFPLLAELRRPEGPPSGAPYLSRESKGNPWVDFLVVIMASGTARGRVRTTTELPPTCRPYFEKETQPWFTVHFVDIGHPYYNQLTAVKTRYPLTSITWPYRGLNFTDHPRSNVFVKLTTDQVLVFRLDRRLMSG